MNCGLLLTLVALTPLILLGGYLFGYHVVGPLSERWRA
jgi:hypothetical protein